MAYEYTFNYANGRKAKLGWFEFPNDQAAVKAAIPIAKDRKRSIHVIKHTYEWEDMNFEIGVVYPNGKIMR